MPKNSELSDDVSDWTLYEHRRGRGCTEMGRPPGGGPTPGGSVVRGGAMPGSRERILAPGADVEGELSFQSPLDRRLPHSDLCQQTITAETLTIQDGGRRPF